MKIIEIIACHECSHFVLDYLTEEAYCCHKDHSEKTDSGVNLKNNIYMSIDKNCPLKDYKR